MFFLTVLACIAFSQVHSQFYNDVHFHTRPYQAGYYIREPHRHQHAEVTRDHGGAVAGRYGYLDARGIGRQVNYVADHAGLKARVHTNEPAIVHNTRFVAAQIASNSVAASGAAVVPAYDSVLGYGYGLNGYGLGYGYNGLDYGYNGLGYGYNGLGYGYNGLGYGYNGLGYGYNGLGYGYGGPLEYSGLLGSYGGVYA